MWRAGLLAIGLSLIAGLFEPAWAESSTVAGRGEVNAVSYREVPQPLSLSVILFDDSSLDLRIRDEMIAALERAKQDLGGEPGYELELSSESQAGGVITRGPSLGRISSSEEDSRIEMNIWSSTQDSILGGRLSDRERITAGSFTILASLRERGGGVVWEGRASVGVERNRADPYLAAMVAALAQNLGRTVRHGSFPVP